MEIKRLPVAKIAGALRYAVSRKPSMKATLFVLFAFVVFRAEAIEKGYVYGNDHCFYFAVPQGWVADNVSGSSQGLPFVFYPSNSTWDAADTVAVALAARGVNDARDQVERTIKLFREDGSPNSRAQKLGTIRARSGAVGDMYRFEGDGWGNTELAVYFSGRKTINAFVMSSHERSDLDKNRAVIEELARSYREANDCKACAGDNATPYCSGHLRLIPLSRPRSGEKRPHPPYIDLSPDSFRTSDE